MAKVLLRSTKDPDRTKLASPRDARVLVDLGRWQYADEAAREAATGRAAPTPNYASLAYNDLRRLAKERGLDLGRATKDELVAALSGADRPGTYQRRDLRAAE